MNSSLVPTAKISILYHGHHGQFSATFSAATSFPILKNSHNKGGPGSECRTRGQLVSLVTGHEERKKSGLGTKIVSNQLDMVLWHLITPQESHWMYYSLKNSIATHGRWDLVPVSSPIVIGTVSGQSADSQLWGLCSHCPCTPPFWARQDTVTTHITISRQLHR